MPFGITLSVDIFIART